MVSPTVHPQLVDVLIRFRMHRIALVADVSKIYSYLCQTATYIALCGTVEGLQNDPGNVWSLIFFHGQYVREAEHRRLCPRSKHCPWCFIRG